MTCVTGYVGSIASVLGCVRRDREEFVKIDAKKRAGAGGRGMRALSPALTCFCNGPII